MTVTGRGLQGQFNPQDSSAKSSKMMRSPEQEQEIAPSLIASKTGINQEVDEFDDAFLEEVLVEFEDKVEESVIVVGAEGEEAASVLVQQAAQLEQELLQRAASGEYSDFDASLAKSMEEMLIKAEEAMNLTSSPSVTTTSTTANTATSFEDSVSNIQSKLRSSGARVKATVESKTSAAASMNPLLAEMLGGSGVAGDFANAENMEEMMKELEGLMENGEFDSMFGGMMDQLMSKELLYEPMQDLATKYPIWLAEKGAALPPEERHRFEEQYRVVREILAIYDAESNNASADSQQQDKARAEEEAKKVANLLKQMQSFGNPPEDIVSELAPGLDLNDNASSNDASGPSVPDECKVQ